ncbi:DUF3035 domain-containing protein [Maritimibacter sp. DP1N21-5]|uniref:DUF3035 domain-containing protein n=1 Tax=Maritimibacter sp. DP1N21-5 TaxID=2836867 RepID=UPI001C480DD9|nr:DUF3035 domain-containing protein [Maritimibacter sp. DP1N21-5]MBV7407873.1 DUF3035 domain-containing protein [Maritimibacter sp. DP1N21-5]
MQGFATKIGLGIAVLALAACETDREPNLFNVRSSTPDEFSIIPTKPLEQPEDYESLPAPTPGGSNRADINPYSDAIVAVGGSEAAYNRGATASENGLLAQAARYGAPANIREQLAEEDLEYRRENNGRLLERLFNVNVYYESYSQQELDQHLEQDRLQQRGVRTPSAPPDPLRY